MITCTACSARLPLSHLCSPLASLTLHWMSEHSARYAELGAKRE